MISRRITFLLFVGLVVIAAGLVKRAGGQPVISPVVEERRPSILSNIFSRRKDPETLRKKIVSEIGNSWKNYSVLVESYNDSFRLDINANVIFTAASVNKIPILSAVYSLAQQNEVDLDKEITLQEEDIQDYGTGSIRYDPPGTVYSVKTLSRLMMQKSDNTAAYLLATYVVGFEKIQRLITSWGLIQTDMVNNKTSNIDMAILMKKIFQGGIAKPGLTQEMLAFFKDGDFENRIPALLPKNVTVYHKTGDAVGNIHDVGIITNGKVTYYIGILSDDVADLEKANKLAAKISKIVYDFMR